MRLANKTGIITGPAKGMGSAISETLAREGADLVLTGRDVAAIEPVAARIRDMGRRAEVIQADVTDARQVEAMVAQAARFFDGRIDILVNVAGITGPIETPVWEITAEDFEAMLRTNVIGTFLPIKYTLPYMLPRKSGKIVNIGGTSGMRGYRYRAAYSSSKWSVRGLTRTVALDVGEYNINVNAVCPGATRTELFEQVVGEMVEREGIGRDRALERLDRSIPLRRSNEPSDIANLVVWLASDQASNVTGQSWNVDGGLIWD
jgi:NAD(P)-dependent dehydrogenase (short-subunit alcohol dehydrogenase family)